MGLNVALIDTSEIIRKMLSHSLYYFGANVQRYENLSSFPPEEDFDLIFVDWELKEGDHPLALVMKEKVKKTPVVALHRESADHLDFPHYLKKPINANLTRELVLRLSEKAQQLKIHKFLAYPDSPNAENVSQKDLQSSGESLESAAGASPLQSQEKRENLTAAADPPFNAGDESLRLTGGAASPAAKNAVQKEEPADSAAQSENGSGFDLPVLSPEEEALSNDLSSAPQSSFASNTPPSNVSESLNPEENKQDESKQNLHKQGANTQDEEGFDLPEISDSEKRVLSFSKSSGDSSVEKPSLSGEKPEQSDPPSQETPLLKAEDADSPASSVSGLPQEALDAASKGLEDKTVIADSSAAEKPSGLDGEKPNLSSVVSPAPAGPRPAGPQRGGPRPAGPRPAGPLKEALDASIASKGLEDKTAIVDSSAAEKPSGLDGEKPEKAALSSPARFSLKSENAASPDSPGSISPPEKNQESAAAFITKESSISKTRVQSLADDAAGSFSSHAPQAAADKALSEDENSLPLHASLSENPAQTEAGSLSKKPHHQSAPLLKDTAQTLKPLQNAHRADTHRVDTHPAPAQEITPPPQSAFDGKPEESVRFPDPSMIEPSSDAEEPSSSPAEALKKGGAHHRRAPLYKDDLNLDENTQNDLGPAALVNNLKDLKEGKGLRLHLSQGAPAKDFKMLVQSKVMELMEEHGRKMIQESILKNNKEFIENLLREYSGTLEFEKTMSEALKEYGAAAIKNLFSSHKQEIIEKSISSYTESAHFKSFVENVLKVFVEESLVVKGQIKEIFKNLAEKEAPLMARDFIRSEIRKLLEEENNGGPKPD